MKRCVTMALSTIGLVASLGSGRLLAQYPYCAQPPLAVNTNPGAVPYMGSSYNFTPPQYAASNYSNYFGPTSYVGGPNYSSSYETPQYAPKYNHYADYTYPKPAYDRSYYYNPGPYYYTPTTSYSPGYYSYYYTPGYFRY